MGTREKDDMTFLYKEKEFMSMVLSKAVSNTCMQVDVQPSADYKEFVKFTLGKP